MKIAWVSADHFYPGVYGDLLGITIDHLKPEATTVCGATALVVSANGGAGKRARHTGMRWLQRFMRETRSTLPALIYSFESKEYLGAKFPMLVAGWDGIRYLRQPFTLADLKHGLDSLAPLEEEQLNECLRWYCDLQSEWHRFAHDLVEALRDWPENKIRAGRVLNDWASSVLAFAPDQRPTLVSLQNVFGGDLREVRAAIQRLEDGLCSKLTNESSPVESRVLPEAPTTKPPLGFSTVMIADDQGYEQATIEDLKRLGYQVADPARNMEEAENLIRYWCPQVVLADLNFPSREEGRRLIHRALSAKCLVIAISRARLTPGDLPAEVEDCCGGLDYQDAERIHRLIWRHALTKGVE